MRISVRSLVKQFSCLLIIAVIGAFSVPSHLWAAGISNDQKKAFDRKVLYFNTEVGGGCSANQGGASLQGGVSLPPETIKYLKSIKYQGKTMDELLKANRDRYNAAEKATKVPWYVVAALHWREANLAPDRTILNGQSLNVGTNVDGMYVDPDANKDAINAAKHFVEMAKSVYGVDVTKGSLKLEEWGQAFVAYNRGNLYKVHGVAWDKSPYAMNGYDAQHMNMHWPGGAADPGVSTRGGGVDGDPVGALAAMTYFGGTNLGGSCAGGADGNFVYYSQADPAWSDVPYGDHGTVRSSGCGPSSMAEVVATLVDKNVTPATIAKKYGRFHGSNGSEPGLFPAVGADYNLKVQTLGNPPAREADVRKTLQSGGYVITSGAGSDPFTSGGHIIAFRAIGPKGGFLLGNPWPPKQFYSTLLDIPSDKVKANKEFYDHEYSWSDLVNAGMHNNIYLITK